MVRIEGVKSQPATDIGEHDEFGSDRFVYEGTKVCGGGGVDALHGGFQEAGGIEDVQAGIGGGRLHQCSADGRRGSGAS
ncbi:MAG: hypothetical protein II092_05780, partial [Lachnospiraceae bacterium]|nr:hypothetical protein [Lachnospiraceae bacterium]